MLHFKDWSIRKKLNLLLMGISTIAVLAACLTFYFLIVDRYRQSYLDDLQSLADITGANCSASLAFGIPEDATQLLASLSKRPSVVTANIRDKGGNLFASYSSSPRANANPTEQNYDSAASNSHSGGLRASHDIELNGIKIGTITLYDDLRPIRAFKEDVLVLLFVIVFVVLGLTSLCAAKLREIISKPISDLAVIADKISARQDYSLRATKESNDEVGHLVDTFNTMLSQIGQRNDDLQKSESRFRAFINQAVDAFFLHDMQGRFVDVNYRACESLGYSTAELLNMTVADIDTKADNQHYQKTYWTKMIPEVPVTMEGTYLRKDGESFPVEVRSGVLELGGEKFIMSFARDISERLADEKKRHQLESQLQQSQKMESIGTLAGGIAHDFNNILTPIFGFLELALLKTPEGTENKKYLTEVRKAAERARDMVKQILAFSRRDSQELAPIQVGIIVKEALKLLRASIPTTIEIRQNIDDQCGSVLANPTQIHQVLMNLCTNAYHAMRETGGVLGVALSQLNVSRKDFIKNVNLKPGPYLLLEISDSGHGMDQYTQEKIFDPYFTTKAQGEGTGMGLSVVHGVVKGIAGHITVYSEVGQGTTFHIYLPVVAESVFLPEVFSESAIPTGTERILIVDDEETIISFEKEMLAALGYDVQSFSDSLAALEHFTAQPEMFDLIITDMTMPKMTGDKLAQKIMAIRPDIPVILCTGFSDLMNEKSAKAMGISQYITKPIIMHSFGRTVRNVLDGVESISDLEGPR